MPCGHVASLVKTIEFSYFDFFIPSNAVAKNVIVYVLAIKLTFKEAAIQAFELIITAYPVSMARKVHNVRNILAFINCLKTF